MKTTQGEACQLTVMTPVDPSQVGALREYLRGLPNGSSSPLATPSTHFGRWVIVERLDDEDGKPDSGKLSCPYLLFTPIFDGDNPAAYLEDLYAHATATLDAVYHHCCGYPPGGSPGEVVTYLLRHAIETDLDFAASPEASVAQVTASLARRAQLIDFVAGNRGKHGAELQSAFKAQVPR